MGERRGVYWILLGKREGKNHLDDLGPNRRIILRLILRKWDVGIWTGLSWLMVETGGGHF
jgi:hypothetical protein